MGWRTVRLGSKRYVSTFLAFEDWSTGYGRLQVSTCDREDGDGAGDGDGEVVEEGGEEVEGIEEDDFDEEGENYKH